MDDAMFQGTLESSHLEENKLKIKKKKSKSLILCHVAF